MKQSKQLFNTPDDAAISFALAYTGLSQQSGKEYGAVIYQIRKNGKFILGKVHIGNTRNVLIIFFEAVLFKTVFRNVAGTIHTHPKAYKTVPPNNWNCGFSFWDNFLPELRYLCAPNGVLYKSENRCENTIVLTGLPKAGVEVSDKEVYPNG